MTQPVSFDSVRAVISNRIAPKQKPDAKPANGAPSAPTPQVPLSKLTDLARRLAADGPPYDNARIAQLSQAIASGDFHVDATAIADAILQRATDREK